MPLSAGTTSAMGLLVTDLKRDYAASMIKRVAELELGALTSSFEALETQGRSDMTREHVLETPTSRSSGRWTCATSGRATS